MQKEITIAIITASWHNEITNALTNDCINELKQHCTNNNIKLNLLQYSVPGSVELPIIAKIVAEKKKVNAIIPIGVVIKGETDHYTYVANQVAYGCQKVAIETNTPVIFGVLTCENIELAKARTNGKHSKSGKEWAQVAIDMTKLVNNI